MTDLDQWRARLATGRERLREAEDLTARTRWALGVAEGQLADARRRGDEALVDRRSASGPPPSASTRRRSSGSPDCAAGSWTGWPTSSTGCTTRSASGDHEVELTGVDRAVPIALFPVRLETRFAGPDEAPVLRVRIFPDDLHVDDHEPDLSQEEVTCGQEYWTAVRAGGAESEAWSTLSARLGPYRALWVREQLQPTNDAGVPTFPDVTLRAEVRRDRRSPARCPTSSWSASGRALVDDRAGEGRRGHPPGRPRPGRPHPAARAARRRPDRAR